MYAQVLDGRKDFLRRVLRLFNLLEVGWFHNGVAGIVGIGDIGIGEIGEGIGERWQGGDDGGAEG